MAAVAVTRLAMVAAVLLIAFGATVEVPFREQLIAMARISDGQRNVAPVELTVFDSNAKRHTHTLRFADVAVSPRAGWYLLNTAVGKDASFLFNIKGLSGAPHNKYLLPWRTYLVCGLDFTIVCGVGDDAPANWVAAKDGCNNPTLQEPPGQAECGCALRYSSTGKSQRYVLHASGLIKILGLRMFARERDGLLEDAQTVLALPRDSHARLDERIQELVRALGAELQPVASVATSMRERVVREVGMDTRRTSFPADPTPTSPSGQIRATEMIDAVNSLDDDDVQHVYDALCTRSPGLCASAPAPAGLTHTASVRKYTVDGKSVRAINPSGDVVQTYKMGEEFTLLLGDRSADGKYSTKRADSEDGTVYWLTVTGGYVRESSDTGELLVSRGVPAEPRVREKHDAALCEAARIHFGWARSDGVHAMESLEKCYPGLQIQIADSGAVGRWQAGLLDAQVTAALNLDLSKVETLRQYQIYQQVSLPFGLQVASAIGHEYRLRKKSLVQPLKDALKATTGLNPRDHGGYIDPVISVHKILVELGDLIDVYKDETCIDLLFKQSNLDYAAALAAARSVGPLDPSVPPEATNYGWRRGDSGQGYDWDLGAGPGWRVLRLQFDSAAGVNRWRNAYSRMLITQIDSIYDVWKVELYWNIDAYARFKKGLDKMATSAAFSTPLQYMTQTLSTTIVVLAFGGDDDLFPAHARSVDLETAAIELCRSPLENPENPGTYLSFCGPLRCDMKATAVYLGVDGIYSNKVCSQMCSVGTCTKQQLVGAGNTQVQCTKRDVQVGWRSEYAGHLVEVGHQFEAAALFSSTAEGFRRGGDAATTFATVATQLAAGTVGDVAELDSTIELVSTLEAWSAGHGVSTAINTGDTPKSESPVVLLKALATRVRVELKPQVKARAALALKHAEAMQSSAAPPPAATVTPPVRPTVAPPIAQPSSPTATLFARQLEAADDALASSLAEFATQFETVLSDMEAFGFYENGAVKVDRRRPADFLEALLRNLEPVARFEFPDWERLNPTLQQVHTRIQLLVDTMKDVIALPGTRTEKDNQARVYLAAVCFGTGVDDVASATFRIKFNGENKLITSKEVMNALRADDGLQGIHRPPAPMVLTQGVGPDWQLHIFLLRAFLGKSFIVWGIEVTLALDKMYELYPDTGTNLAWTPVAHSRACVANLAQEAGIYVAGDAIGNLGYKVKQGSGHAALRLMEAQHSLVSCYPPAMQQPLLFREVSWRAVTSLGLDYDPAIALEMPCEEVISRGYKPAIANILWADTLVKIPTQSDGYSQSIRSTSMHLLVDDGEGHFIDEVRKSQHCNAVRGATVFEDKHKDSREVNVQTKGQLKNQLPIWEQFIVTATASAHAQLENNAPATRRLQKEAKRNWESSKETLQLHLQCLQLVQDARDRMRNELPAELVVDRATGECSLHVPVSTPAPLRRGWVRDDQITKLSAWAELRRWEPTAGTWDACPDAWPEDGTVPASPLCLWNPRSKPAARRTIVSGKCGGNHDIQGRPSTSEPDVICPTGQELRAAIDGRTVGDCCHGRRRIGKCVRNTDAQAEPDVVCNPGRVYRKNIDTLSRGKDSRLFESKCCKAGPRQSGEQTPDQDDSEPTDLDEDQQPEDLEQLHDEQQIDAEDFLEPDEAPDPEDE